MTRLPPDRRKHGIHMLRTEAETLDEALDILARKNREPRQPQRQTLALEMARNNLRQMCRPITLSDRVVRPFLQAPASRRKPTVIWTKEQIVAAYATGAFKIRELAIRGRVSNIQIIFWLHGEADPPIHWRCGGCGIKNNSPRGMGLPRQPICRCCGKVWHEGLQR